MSEIMEIAPLGDKLRAFGWNVVEIDGHDVPGIADALERLPDPRSEVPTVIVANTVKGKGIPWMENSVTWHYGGLDTELEKKALVDLDQSYRNLIEEFKKLSG